MRLIEGTFAVEIRPVLARVVGVPLTERFTRSRRSTWKAYSLKASPTRTRPRERSGSGFPPTPPDNPVRPFREKFPDDAPASRAYPPQPALPQDFTIAVMSIPT